MPTVRLSTTQASPSTYFALECDWTTEVSNNRTRLVFGVRCKNGSSGTTGSQYNGSGFQRGYIDGALREERSQNPFLPSGYAANQERWYEGGTYYLTHDADGNVSDNNAIALRMVIAYGAVAYDQSYALNVARIPEAPGKPGTPTFTNITPTGVTISWSAAARGHADIIEYQYQYDSDGATFPSPGSIRTGLSRSALRSDLSPGTQYWVRVRARNADGWGDWSTVATFTTPSAMYIGKGGVFVPVAGVSVGKSNTFPPAEVLIGKNGSFIPPA
jgi:hypothetical protein